MKLLLVDDHTLFREGMGHVLAELHPDLTIFEAASCADAISVCSEHPDIDMALIDLALAGESGMECLVALRARASTLPLVVLSATESRQVMSECIRLGASGYVTKSSSSAVMLHALRLVLAGGVYVPYESAVNKAPMTLETASDKGLTQRQLDVLRLLVQGKPNKEIGSMLGMAEPTVRVHVTAILKHLGVGNRTEAALKAIALDLVTRPVP